jgi:hypothetical protein
MYEDVVLEDGFEENPSVQIGTSRNQENSSEEIMKGNLKIFHVQRENLESTWQNFFLLEFLLCK